MPEETTRLSWKNMPLPECWNGFITTQATDTLRQALVAVQTKEGERACQKTTRTPPFLV